MCLNLISLVTNYIYPLDYLTLYAIEKNSFIFSITSIRL